MPFLPGFLSVYPGKSMAGGFVEELLNQWGEVKLDQSFRAKKVLPFIRRVALPWSSISHFHCLCCHFSNASMGTGICMTPPPPPLTTNSSVNTSAKRLVRHTVFELVPFSPFRLNDLSFVVMLMWTRWNTIEQILSCWSEYLRSDMKVEMQWKHILFEKAMTVMLNLLAMQFILWFTSCMHVKVVKKCKWVSPKGLKQRDLFSAD